VKGMREVRRDLQDLSKYEPTTAKAGNKEEYTMHLSGFEIVKLGFVKNPNQARIRPAGYDLTLDQVIVDGDSHPREVWVIPQGMFVIVSKEHVNIPEGYVAYALPKTSLCQEGILTLNTGILDPGYDGLISTVGINFNNRPHRLRKDDPFLRLVFHKIEGENAEQPDTLTKVLSNEDYLEVRADEAKRFPNTFLDVENSRRELVNEISKATFIKQVTAALGVTAIVGVILTFMAFGLNKYSESAASSIMARAANEYNNNEYFRLRIGNLREENTLLRAKLESIEKNHYQGVEEEFNSLKEEIKSIQEKLNGAN
jgi:deoxycytidine triphosphate deaminase